MAALYNSWRELERGQPWFAARARHAITLYITFCETYLVPKFPIRPIMIGLLLRYGNGHFEWTIQSLEWARRQTAALWPEVPDLALMDDLLVSTMYGLFCSGRKLQQESTLPSTEAII